MNESEVKYLKMFGLDYNPIVAIDDYLGIISKNDVILGFSRKKGNKIEVILDEKERQNTYSYKALYFKKLKNNTIQGTMTVSKNDTKKKINYIYDSLEDNHTIEMDSQTDLIQLHINQKSINAIINEKTYKCYIENSYCLQNIDREKIKELVSYYYDYIPELIMNVIKEKNIDSELRLHLESGMEEKGKTKRLKL